MSQISPILLQAQISPPAGGGSFGLADTTRLENPFQGPMWIDEIRFRLPGGAAVTGAGQAWSSMRVELKLGNIPLTYGFVPISLLGKVQNDLAEGVYSLGSPDCFTWKLPKPLYVPARELLRPTIYYDTYAGAPAKTVTIIYACRPVEKGTPAPSVLQVPWVTYFQPPYLSCSLEAPAVNTTNQSAPSDIFNPWDEELHVQRFIGRLMIQNHGENSGYLGLSDAAMDMSTGAIRCGTLVSAQDSFNNILIRDRTPFAHVFDFIDRAWTVNCILPPKGFYLFTLERIWDTYVPPTATDFVPVIATLGISMVGWREMRVRGPSDRMVR